MSSPCRNIGGRGHVPLIPRNRRLWCCVSKLQLRPINYTITLSIIAFYNLIDFGSSIIISLYIASQILDLLLIGTYQTVIFRLASNYRYCPPLHMCPCYQNFLHIFSQSKQSISERRNVPQTNIVCFSTQLWSYKCRIESVVRNFASAGQLRTHLRVWQVCASCDRKKPSAQSQVLEVAVVQQNWLQPPLLFRHAPVQWHTVNRYVITVSSFCGDATADTSFIFDMLSVTVSCQPMIIIVFKRFLRSTCHTKLACTEPMLHRTYVAHKRWDHTTLFSLFLVFNAHWRNLYCRSTQGCGENSVDQILWNLVTGANIYNIQLQKWQIAPENKSDPLPSTGRLWFTFNCRHCKQWCKVESQVVYDDVNGWRYNSGTQSDLNSSSHTLSWTVSYRHHLWVNCLPNT